MVAGDCDITFDDSSPAIVLERAPIIWRKSIKLHNVRYKWMVSDGNSKAFRTVQNAYMEMKMIKSDCVGHVQKRMGKHFHTVIAMTKREAFRWKTNSGPRKAHSH